MKCIKPMWPNMKYGPNNVTKLLVGPLCNKLGLGPKYMGLGIVLEQLRMVRLI